LRGDRRSWWHPAFTIELRAFIEDKARRAEGASHARGRQQLDAFARDELAAEAAGNHDAGSRDPGGHDRALCDQDLVAADVAFGIALDLYRRAKIELAGNFAALADARFKSAVVCGHNSGHFRLVVQPFRLHLLPGNYYREPGGVQTGGVARGRGTINPQAMAYRGATIFLDLRGVKCPLNWAYAKVRLERMDRGDMLDLVLDDPRGARDIPQAAEAEGYSVIEVADLFEARAQRGDAAGAWRVKIEK